MLVVRIFSVIFPLVFIISVGYFYARFRPIEMTSINQLNVAIFTPALLLTVLTDKSFNIVAYQQLALAVMLILLCSGLLVWPLIRWLGIDLKTFLPAMMFVNTGNMGIPVALFAFGEPALPMAILFFIIATILNFTLGIYLVSGSASWLNLVKLPLIQATFIGLLLNLMTIKIPALLLKPIEMLGMCAAPIMLFSLGVQLVKIDLTHWKIGLLGAILRPLSGILAYWLIRPWFSLTPLQASGLLVLAVLPPAVINYIIAEQYQQEPHQVAAIVMLGNLMSLVSLPIALVWALPHYH
jgi:predicted permease